MKKPKEGENLNALEFDEEKAIERAKHEDSEGYFGFLTGAEWQHAQDKIIYDKLIQVIREQRVALNDICESDDSYESKTWDIADKAIESTDKILKEMGIEI